ncbi:hypothetical protein [Nocardia stercoris]|uniref:Uncharacterized protein n=1 Tax=Nocardia stercoris TaxID=2483361 RepID=A0A3M2LE98_9NOCA|nr:hypothetical protein [Nocardia stercoris]RMI34913.1 hypothetical protein EBN03_00650 [Nocardia stercoris]
MGETNEGHSEPVDLALRLLDAQVAFAKEQLLRGEGFLELVVEEVDGFLGLAAELTLAESVTPERIKAVARKWAVQVPVEGAIPELVGEIAARLYNHQANDATQVDDVVDTQRFEQFMTAVADMDVTHRLVRLLLTSPATVDACVEIVQRAVVAAVDDGRHLDGGGVAGALKGALARLAEPALPAIENGVGRITRTGARFVLRGNRNDADETLLEVARENWRRHTGDAVGSFRELVSADDVEDAVVLVFEFWRTFRDTDYFRALLDEGIDHVFDKYGDTPLAELLAELGVGRADLIEEAFRFGPPVLATLDERGYLDTILRRRLAPFYASEAFRAALRG